MSPIEVPVPPDYFAAAARVRIVCPWHLTELRALLRTPQLRDLIASEGSPYPVSLADYCCDVGHTHEWWKGAPDDFEHFVSHYAPTAEERSLISSLGLEAPVARPKAANDVAHFRYRLRCPRPSCNYCWEARAEWHDDLRRSLDLLLQSGQVDGYFAEQASGVMSEVSA